MRLRVAVQGRGEAGSLFRLQVAVLGQGTRQTQSRQAQGEDEEVNPERGACGFVLTGQPDRIQNGISFGLSAFQSERSLPQLNVESRVTALGGLELNLVSLVVLVDVNDHRLLERLG